MKQKNETPEAKVIASFWQHVKTNRPLIRQRNKKDALGQHTSDIRNAFAEYIDSLLRENKISSDLANNISLYQNETIK